MIEISDAYKNVEQDGQIFGRLEFDCEHCERRLNQFRINLSIFLYGVAFITGNEFSYAGVTCPVCRNTILLKGTDLTYFINDMAYFEGPSGTHLVPSFRYHSSILHSPKQIEHLDPFDICYSTFPVSVSEPNFDETLAQVLESEPNLEQDYMCSYRFGDEIPIGPYASVWWFRPEQIESLVQIENEHQLRVFPRYVHKMDWYGRYNAFCWRYKLSQDFLKQQKKESAEDHERLREHCRQENINLDNLLAENPEIIAPDVLEQTERQVQEEIGQDFQAASEFLDLLLNYDPEPWDVGGEISSVYKGFWKSRLPLQRYAVPENIQNFEPDKYGPKLSDDNFRAIAGEIRSRITKTHVQQWALENHLSFIEEYIDKARRADFSYGHLLSLKIKYLSQLHRVLDQVSIEESRYAFFPEGPSWTIKYNGKTIRALRGNGFKYIQFLISNPGQTYNTIELDEMDKCAPGLRRVPDGNLPSKHSMDADHHGRTDKKAKNQFISQLVELQRIIDEAKRTSDQKALDSATDEYPFIREHLKKDFGKKIPQTFISDAGRKKDKIAQAIRRAISRIKKHDPEIAEHFRRALKPINSFQQGYHPDKPIEWKMRT